MKTSTLETKTLKPMYLAESAAWFGGFALILILSIYGLVPHLSRTYFSEYERFVIGITIPLILIFLTAIGIYWFQNGMTLKGLPSRYRMNNFRATDILWGVGAFIAGLIGMGILSAVGAIFLPYIPIPNNLPMMLDPHMEMNIEAFNQMVGGNIAGNWKVLVIYGIMLFFNIAGEELLWRGYILPRQELAFGKRTWIIHGILWTLFHSFKWWDMLSLLPVCLVISFVAQKRRSLWPGFIAHYLINGMGLLLFLAGVLGFLN